VIVIDKQQRQLTCKGRWLTNKRRQ